MGLYDDDPQIYLIAQMLPCSMEVVDANPALRSDHTRGILADKWKVYFDEFDGKDASGKTVFLQKVEKLRKI